MNIPTETALHYNDWYPILTHSHIGVGMPTGIYAEPTSSIHLVWSRYMLYLQVSRHGQQIDVLLFTGGIFTQGIDEHVWAGSWNCAHARIWTYPCRVIFYSQASWLCLIMLTAVDLMFFPPERIDSKWAF